mmetsp:Transcript_26451/g.40621  ORF Transcript_26451/g.40621 Transcript_26451/m.40621 type:complete len:197 (+) Transcript_26451:32-622(+)|eukprot:CAMPEP_0118693756 /NCGR_PEP_ID=MMETSP0800-20121206/12098_1 /TAXON_ID=210618 ORGANISM="Striatella unipunctata, Strain CCMP2910" /NCGR_SAMPLE_ID=MMETSP0800 /ASSEMBLY_ACC=CAM_ASM_000638 /LENGTH=196 /DNA_ID=CAMNT_0006592053 /DNA_START=16 /DNA_END=606 /DNA_ORIENTATION=-
MTAMDSENNESNGGSIVHAGFDRLKASLRAEAPELAAVNGSTNGESGGKKGDMQVKMDVLMGNPELWKEFQQVLKESNCTTVASIQHILHDFLHKKVVVDEHPAPLPSPAKYERRGSLRNMLLKIASMSELGQEVDQQQVNDKKSWSRASSFNSTDGGAGEEQLSKKYPRSGSLTDITKSLLKSLALDSEQIPEEQ